MVDFSSIGGVPVQSNKLDFSSVESSPSPSLEDAVKGIVGKAVDEALMRKGSSTRDLATNPVTQAKVLPALAGTGGAVLPIPGGATLGTIGGRQISNLALKAYGKPEEIPSGTQQVLEGGLAALGDITAIPAIKKSSYGKQIGAIEAKAGVPQFPDSLPRPTGPGSTVKFIDDTRKAIATGEIGTDEPIILKQIKDQIDFIYKNRKDVPLSNSDEGKLAMLSGYVQSALNKAISGRGPIAANMARSLAIPNTISDIYRKLPAPVRAGIGFSAAPTGVGLAYELGKRILGGNQ